jgi:hypothetical protein
VGDVLKSCGFASKVAFQEDEVTGWIAGLVNSVCLDRTIVEQLVEFSFELGRYLESPVQASQGGVGDPEP